MGLTDAEIKHELFIDEQAEALDEAINRLNEKTKPSSEEMLNSFLPLS